MASVLVGTAQEQIAALRREHNQLAEEEIRQGKNTIKRSLELIQRMDAILARTNPAMPLDSPN